MLFTADLTSLFITVFLPECLAKLTASEAIFNPISSKIFVKAILASLLILVAPAFFIILPAGATGNSKNNTPHFYVYLIHSIFS